VTVSKNDYEEKVLKTLKDYQRKSNMPGFRPGKVPFGLVSKMYRKAVMLDEINQLVAENLQQYIEQNQLKLLGNPLPDRDKTPPFDFEDMTEFDFHFDIGMAPEFDLEISKRLKADYYNIKPTDKMVDEYVKDLQKRYGTHHHDHDEDEQHDENQESDHEHHIEPAELNESFFRMIFPGEEIKDEAAFREKVRDGIERSLVRESDRFFLNMVTEMLVEDIKIELPDSFIRKMLQENEETQMTAEQVDAQYENFAKSIKWQLIESKLLRDHGLKVEEQEMRNAVRSYFTGNMVNNEENPEQDERLNKIIDSVLSNREEATRLHDQLFDQKMLEFFKSSITLQQKDINYDDFVKKVTDKKQ
jgi:FKBP-type peptidyl-prolyl cis-trans isomerase (trigger factor)